MSGPPWRDHSVALHGGTCVSPEWRHYEWTCMERHQCPPETGPCMETMSGPTCLSMSGHCMERHEWPCMEIYEWPNMERHVALHGET